MPSAAGAGIKGEPGAPGHPGQAGPKVPTPHSPPYIHCCISFLTWCDMRSLTK